jgi:nicotinamide phosphoribosyltransferase
MTTQINTDNLILKTDSYKISHYKQYPPNTTRVHSYVESRGGLFDETVFFGLQAFLKKYFTKPITMKDIDEAELICNLHGFQDFNRAMWERIVTVHNGRLPVEIKAVPEGTVVPTRNVLVTIENTDSECAPLTSYLETALLRGVWYTTTVASLSYNMKKIIRKFMDETTDDDAVDGAMPFKLHDFGARGVSSAESAELGGLAHLVNFMGTDTIEALVAAHKYYNMDITTADGMPGFSIPAAEHSTITSWGRENEAAAFENMLDAYGREGALLAVVSDSYDIYNACEHIWGEQLREKVIASGATVVVRPDSGYPPEVVVKCLELLGEKFGTTTNSKGYKVLNNVRVIQGDGIDIEMLEVILENVKAAGFSADNLAFGCGGGLLQKVDRDTQKFALKCSAMQADGEWIDVYKDPVTDPGKVSKKGRQMLFRDTRTGKLFTAKDTKQATYHEPVLRTVFKNGELLVDEDLNTVRARATL